MADDPDEITPEDILNLHEDILDENEDGIRHLVFDFQEDGISLSDISTRELEIEPLAEDHKLNGLPLTALHRAALIGSTSILNLLFTADPSIDKNYKLKCNGFTPLHVATSAGITKVASYLAANGACVNEKDAVGQTPMHLAAQDGFIDIAKILVVKGSSVNSKDRSNKTPLHLAAEAGHTKIVNFLIKRDADVDVVDKLGQTPLHKAQLQGHPNTTEALLANGSDVNRKDNSGKTPLYIAIENFHSKDAEDITVVQDRRRTKSIEFLLNTPTGNDANLCDFAGCSPLHLAVAGNHLPIARKLVENGAIVDIKNKYGETPLFYATTEPVMFYLISEGADINHQNSVGDSVLHTYAANDDVATSMVILLAEQGARVDVLDNEQESAIFKACKCGHLEKVACFIDLQVQTDIVNQSGESLLHVALRCKHSELALFLIFEENTGVDVNSPDYSGSTLMHIAVQNNDLSAVQLLLSKAASVNIKDHSGKTPADLAVELRHIEILRYLLLHGGQLASVTRHASPFGIFATESDLDIIQILLEQGLDINMKDGDSNTGLQAALSNKAWDVARCLLCENASCDTANKDNSTPLHTACKYAAPEDILLSLIDRHTVQINSQDKDGRTPLHISIEERLPHSVQILVDHGALLELRDRSNRAALDLCIMLAMNVHDTEPQEDVRCQIYLDMLQILLRRDGRMCVNNKDTQGRHPLHCISHLQFLQGAKLLLQKGAELECRDAQQMTPLHIACHNGDLEMVTLYLKYKADIEACDVARETPFYHAVRSGNVDVVDTMIAEGCNIDSVNSKGRSPLHQALCDTNSDIVELLVTHDVQVDVKDHDHDTPLHLAARSSPGHIVEALLTQGASVNAPNRNGDTPLHFSVYNPDLSVIKILIKNRADINSTNHRLDTPVHMCAKDGSYDHVDVLISYGAELDLQNGVGETPVHLASLCPETDVLELLIANEACLDVRDKAGKTALISATEKENYEAALILCEQETTASVKDQRGENALHKCVRMNSIHKPLIKTLLKKGASLDEENDDGETPISILRNRSIIEGDDVLVALNIA